MKIGEDALTLLSTLSDYIKDYCMWGKVQGTCPLYLHYYEEKFSANVKPRHPSSASIPASGLWLCTRSFTISTVNGTLSS